MKTVAVDISDETSLDLEEVEEPDPSQEIDLALLGESGPGPASDSVGGLASQEINLLLPQEMARLDSLLTELQEDTDNTKSLIEETYHSYKAILEQCMNNSLAELEKRHHSKELAIMEKLEEIEKTKRQLEMSLLWEEKNFNDGQNSSRDKLVSEKMESLMKYLQVSLSIPLSSFLM